MFFYLTLVILKHGCIFSDIPSTNSQDLCPLHLELSWLWDIFSKKSSTEVVASKAKSSKTCRFHFVHWNTSFWRSDPPCKEVWLPEAAMLHGSPRSMGAGLRWALNQSSRGAKHLCEETSRKFQPLPTGIFLTEAPEIVEQRIPAFKSLNSWLFKNP